MNDRDERFERDLKSVLRATAGEEAPMSLRYRLSDITERAPIGHRSWFITPMRLSFVVAGLAVLALALLLWPRADVGPGPSESPTPSQSQSQSAEPSGSAEPTPTLVPSAEQPTTAPTVPPTPVPTTAPGGDWTGLVWSDPVTPSSTVHLYDLVPWGDGYVAVGELPTASDRSDAGFLTSSDGVTWRVAYRVDPGLDRFPQHLVALDGQVLAFSHKSAREDPHIQYDGPVVWKTTAPDGSTWSRLDSQSWNDAWAAYSGWPSANTWIIEQQPIEWGLHDVAASPAGLVVIGNWLVDDVMTPIVLHSPDGQTWSAVALPSGSTSPVLNSVAEHNGRFVITGATDVGPDASTARAAAWYSDDGVMWKRATVEQGDFPQAGGFEFGPVWAGEDGLLTCSGSRSMTAGGWRYMEGWTSQNGATWQYAPWEYAAGFGPHAGCDWSASDGSRIVSLGPRAHASPVPWSGVSVAWTSTDGVQPHSQRLELSSTVTDPLERFWVVPDGVIYAGEQSFWFGTPTFGP